MRDTKNSSNTKRNIVQLIYKPGYASVAWQVLYRVQTMGLGMALVYLAHDVFIYEGEKNTMVGFSLLPVYLLFLFLLMKYPENKLVKNSVVLFNFLSLILSFLYLAGNHYISTPTVIDFSLSFLVITIVYSDWQRLIWIFAHAVMLSVFIVLSILSYSPPEPEIYILQSRNDFIFGHIEVFSRLIFIFILGFTFVKDYDRQRKLVFDKNEQVRDLNKNLELLVKSRTEKLGDLNKKLTEYSFLNSHKVRAPLARIMGIINLIETEKNKTQPEVLEKYLALLKESSEELDNVIREMNRHLSDQEEQLV